MAGWKSRVGKLALALAGTLVAGCPQDLQPSLSATPGAVDFGATQTARNISLSNTGGGVLEWTAAEVTRANADAPWVTDDVPWLTLSSTEGSVTDQLQNLTLTASRVGLGAGLYTNSGVQVASNGGTVTIPVSLSVEAVLQAIPSAISLSATDTVTSFSILNNGLTPLNWTLSYLPDPEDSETVTAFPPGFTVEPATGTNQAQSSTVVTLTLPPGRQDFAILVNSNAGNQTVTFDIGTGLTGLTVSPAELTVSVVEGLSDDASQPSSTLTLQNTGGTAVSWTIRVRDRLNPDTVAPIAAEPILGTTAAGGTSEVQVRVTDISAVVSGDGRYELIVRSGDAFQSVPIIVDVLPLPVIELSRAPDTQVLQPPVVPTDLLDFGTEMIQLQFWIANIGDVDSDLYFLITHDDQMAARPLLASVAPLQGNTNGPDQDFYLSAQDVYIDGVPVTVTIDRSALMENVETRTITVRAFNSTFSERQTAVEEATIQVRVEKQPFTITGALNRGRPPNLLRYVLSNRDEFGQVVPLQTDVDRARLAYDIFEDEAPLDLTETNQFVTYDYRGNVVLMLDYTGSMYTAGTAGDGPLRPGDAVQLMRDAAATFIDDLPSNYDLQLMYYSDRVGEDRIIQRFTNDRAVLKDALQRFTLPEALFGSSDIYDALLMAMENLVAADPPTTLPFDDADVRAIVYITDGEDTVSAVSLNEVEGRAEETRTRLFPVSYSPNGEPTNLADMLVLADSSGGYLYNAGTATDLRTVLGTQRNMRLIPEGDDGAGNAIFTIENLSSQAIFYDVTEEGDSPWLGTISAGEGLIGARGTQEVSVSLLANGADSGDVVQGALNVAAGNGTGQVVVQFESAGGTNVTDIKTVVRDEPGTLWYELNNQSVVTYMTPKESPFVYLLSGRYNLPDGRVIEGAFERDGVFIIGDPTIGQISLRTEGIFEDLTTVEPDRRFRAEVFVYADYIPRNITAFSFRFYLQAPADAPAGSAALLENANVQVELAGDGILADDDIGTADWRLISDGEGRYRLITDEDNYLPVASFGNMLKLTISGLEGYVANFGDGARQPEFFLSMRLDNQIYVAPGSDRQPSTTKYFLYPGGLANPDRALSVELDRGDLAPPAPSTGLLLGFEDFNPENLGAFDVDEDSYPSFNDPAPLDEGIPGPQIVPNPFEVSGDVDTFTLQVVNTTLDRYDWSLTSLTASQLLDALGASPDAVTLQQAQAALPALTESEFDAIDRDEDGLLFENELSIVALPDWLPLSGIRYGADMGTVPRRTLLPGESEQIHFAVDRAGQVPGTTDTSIVLFDIDNSEYAFFAPEEVPLTLVTNP